VKGFKVALRICFLTHLVPGAVLGLDVWIWMGGKSISRAVWWVGPWNLNFFWPKWHSLRSLPFQGPKKFWFQSQPLQTVLVTDFPPSKSIGPAHINNRYNGSSNRDVTACL
jgi:hypothetical protein